VDSAVVHHDDVVAPEGWNQALLNIGEEQFSYDPSGLKELKPALDQLAKRRQRIVHHGDLLDRAPDVDSWRFADFWQLMHWNLNVVGALYVLLPAVTEQNELYTKADSCHFEA
jgi:hypothetical protein